MIELSVVIPNYNSPFTHKTIENVLKAGCEVEVIVNVDGEWPVPLSEDPRVHYIHGNSAVGLREAVNRCVRMAKGKYIMKTDDHCAFGENYGKTLIEEHKEDNWVQIPRRYALDPDNWCPEKREDDKYPVDYMYIDFPRKGKDHDDGMHGVPWKERREERKDILVDETPSMQGSCYFMTRNHFLNTLGGLNSEQYGVFAQESQEIGFKTWLGGGKVMVNKRTFYCHLHKGSRYGRFYKFPGGTIEASNWSAIHWVNDEEPNMKYTFKWFIEEKFPNMPSWSSNWEEILRQQGTLKK